MTEITTSDAMHNPGLIILWLPKISVFHSVMNPLRILVLCLFLLAGPLETAWSQANNRQAAEQQALNVLKEVLKEKTLWYIAWNDFPAVFNRPPDRTFFGALAKAGVMEIGPEVGEGAAKKYTYSLTEFGKSIATVPTPMRKASQSFREAKNAFFLGRIRPTGITEVQFLVSGLDQSQLTGYKVTFTFEVFDKPEWVPQYEQAYKEMIGDATAKNEPYHGGWFSVQGPEGEFLSNNSDDGIFFHHFYDNGLIKATITKSSGPNAWSVEFYRSESNR